MENKIQHYEDIIKEVANKIGQGWKFNHIYSNAHKDMRSSFYLFNPGNKLFIKIQLMIHDKPCISIGYMSLNDPSEFIDVISINCSLDKSINSISTDIKNRLIAVQDKAIEIMNQRIKEHQNNLKDIEEGKTFMNLIKFITYVEPRRSYQRFSIYKELDIKTGCNGLDDKFIKQFSTNGAIDKQAGNTYRLRLESLHEDLLFKILALVEQEQKEQRKKDLDNWIEKQKRDKELWKKFQEKKSNK